VEHDRGCEFEARLALYVFFEIEMWLKLEAGLAAVDEGADHVRVAFDLPDIRQPLVRDVVFRFHGEERLLGCHAPKLFLLISVTWFRLPHIPTAATIVTRLLHICSTGRCCLVTLRCDFEELFDLVVDRFGQLGELPVVQAAQVSL